MMPEGMPGQGPDQAPVEMTREAAQAKLDALFVQANELDERAALLLGEPGDLSELEARAQSVELQRQADEIRVQMYGVRDSYGLTQPEDHAAA